MAKKNEETLPEKVEQGNMAVAQYQGYSEYAGQGYEGTDQDDFSLPFINVLQALSPQVSGESAIDGAKAGMLFNTATNEVFDGSKGFLFVPAHRERLFIEWTPRDQGGGFVARHEQASDVVNWAKANVDPKTPNKLKTANGNDLMETAQIVGIIVGEDGTTQPAVLAFTSTKLKVYRHLMTKLTTFTIPVKFPDGQTRKVNPPIFANLLRVTTVPEKNQKGSFYNLRIAPANGDSLVESLLPTEDDRFQTALALRQSVESGEAKANYESQAEEAATGATAGDGSVPF